MNAGWVLAIFALAIVVMALVYLWLNQRDIEKRVCELEYRAEHPKPPEKPSQPVQHPNQSQGHTQPHPSRQHGKGHK
jgi:hypothetical protein